MKFKTWAEIKNDFGEMIEGKRQWFYFFWHLDCIRWLNYVPIKRIRRLWCDHLGHLTTSPNVQDCIDMGTEITITCKNCKKYTVTSAYHIIFGGWDGEL